jgi:acyl-CoA synthetase (NDP forming)
MRTRLDDPAPGLEVPQLTEMTKTQLQEAVADFGNMNNPLDGTGAMYDGEKIFPRLLQALIDDAHIDVDALVQIG